ncbi:hypothetical protein GUJ93_ZPchr0001g30886 [Zizania palustris]|uniref:Uncharacterized protein n=1 Tax=Zizania palustris TaxID=103762 RepID=A0A8J5RV95_ZIZPA|nr:hypothetical protein GUJ93_ZPchr0001g30886 [Zizania palustris]
MQKRSNTQNPSLAGVAAWVPCPACDDGRTGWFLEPGLAPVQIRQYDVAACVTGLATSYWPGCRRAHVRTLAERRGARGCVRVRRFCHFCDLYQLSGSS